MPDMSSPNEESSLDPEATQAQPSVAEIARRIAAEHGDPPPSPIELEDWVGPEHALAEPQVVGRAPVERKVLAGSVWATLGPTLLAVLALLAQNIDVLAPVLAAAPPWVKFGVLILAGGVSSFYGAYRAEHTPRPDLAG